MADECPKCEDGLPAWLATFADLMSLLMCFFVLLLSFATMDAVRFKKMAESMKDAFGVQREVPAIDVVMGTSIVMTEFSPTTTPEPSPIDEVRQQTTEVEKQHLDVKDAMEAVAEQIKQEIQEQAEQLREELREEIGDGKINVEAEEARIVIRIEEKGSFPSGSDRLDPAFYDVMDRISGVVVNTPGKVIVAGHTDDVPISTTRFRSNWELSSARAVTVVHALLQNPAVDESRVVVEGRADSAPLVPNSSSENRARNRRVELIIERSNEIENAIPQTGPTPG
ncbi:MAG: flagellar motor protein MotB [Candidatus Sedimenticola endophacoides]|uniref:Flagellar motor protein MotB n=1 Tax=Candidatus Sedimenticola endophacoides TaxID=2548426 RepID=A0A657PZW1_9GAMM|nr:MAG: flagellar motor protein MotB [Candidatus Sedimenticola endophacoides]OQX33084.1 MAG: flagellar motor protein MotB [Candidatus Sedimenticola endophacoides]OQX33399.1 MAG: flagellar motor protein MotB [Candidatus Sedimenticola endophacoides]OQX42531.1 MAG: flagellar motor protein MotB [Candidatus Sedimenticola endophacoides]OQX42646.1 MAG: flagellar motor protein MotB [Candidatus Sedimenticola endophacoides]